jgi:predicted thioesterase
LAAAPIGSVVTFTSEIIGVEERRVLFQVVATTEDEVIGEGTHERGIINIAKFATRLAEKMRRK